MCTNVWLKNCTHTVPCHRTKWIQDRRWRFDLIVCDSIEMQQKKKKTSRGRKNSDSHRAHGLSSRTSSRNEWKTKWKPINFWFSGLPRIFFPEMINDEICFLKEKKLNEKGMGNGNIAPSPCTTINAKITQLFIKQTQIIQLFWFDFFFGSFLSFFPRSIFCSFFFYISWVLI